MLFCNVDQAWLGTVHRECLDNSSKQRRVWIEGSYNSRPRRKRNLAAPFVSITTYLAVIPLLLGLAASVWSCLTVIAAHYGLDLTGAVDWFHVDQSVGMPAQFALLIVSALVFAWGAKMGPGWLWYRVGAIGVMIALITMPYWLNFPMPLIWGVAVVIVSGVGWRKFRS